MNSRKKRFWEQWQKRNRELAEKDIAEANKRREIKFLGYPIETIADCSMDRNHKPTFKEKFDRIDAESMTTEELFAENGTTEREYLDKAMEQVRELIHPRPL